MTPQLPTTPPRGVLLTLATLLGAFSATCQPTPGSDPPRPSAPRPLPPPAAQAPEVDSGERTSAGWSSANHASWIRSFPFLEDVIRRVGTDGRWDLFEYVALHRWSAGRVAIVGDAANAMSPNTGQGAGTPGMNALSLAVFATEAPTLEEGLARWESKERPLTEHTQLVAGVWGALTRWPTFIRMPILCYGARSKWLMGHRQRAAHHVPTGAEAFAPRPGPPS